MDAKVLSGSYDASSCATDQTAGMGVTYTAIQENPASTKNVTTKLLTEVFISGLMEPVGFIDSILQEAVSLNASDILFEPEKETIRVRFRIDGVLYDVGRFDHVFYASIAARVKILSHLNSTEKRKTQEGQFTFDQNGAAVNIRVEIVQSIHDELIVMRILKLSSVVMELAQLGFSKQAYTQYTEMLKYRSGLILVCGPTGSGKTTTLYSTIHFLNQHHEYNIVTIEDPVEYQLSGVNQMPVRLDTGFTFEEGLRVTLRLTPDIVLVGEIRDRNTAMIAVESGLTGHMILSTIHTPDAVGVIYRMLDLGIEPYFINASIKGIIAQRLVRKNCPKCQKQYQPGPDESVLFEKYLKRVPNHLTKSVGCPECQNLGFKGRIGIYEILKNDGPIRNFIRERTSEDELRGYLEKQNFITLMKDGLLKAEAGFTTVDEVMRNSLRIE